jgi:hypothetical protein
MAADQVHPTVEGSFRWVEQTTTVGRPLTLVCTSIGMNIDKRAPKALHTEKFSGKADDLQLFLKMFKMRGAEFRWFTTERNPAIGMIAESPGQVDTPVYNMIEEY